MATSLSLTPIMFFSKYDFESEWTSSSDPYCYFSNDNLIELSGVSVARDKVTNVTQEIDISFTENEDPGERSFEIGLTNTLAIPQTTSSSFYVQKGLNQLNFEVSVGIDISKPWYIYLAEKQYGTRGTINDVVLTFSSEKTIKYCIEGRWVACIPYYAHDGAWVKCQPFYCKNQVWEECSTQ